MNKHDIRFDRVTNGLSKSFKFLSGFLNWIKSDKAVLWRPLIGVLFVLGSLFSFLPLFGIWMLPVGLLILAIDVKIIRQPVSYLIIKSKRFIRTFLKKFKNNS